MATGAELGICWGGQSNRQVDPKPEFQDWVRYNGGQYRRYLDPISAGEYSDDTQLILAVARALQTPDWFATLTRTELPLFLLYQRGAGASTLRACRSWAAGSAPWEGGTSEKSQKAQQRYFSAGGNGVAMRIAPHAVSCGTLDRLELVGRVIKDGVATHGHPRALVGAAAYAVALHKLLTIDGPLEYGSLATELVEDTSWQDAELAMDALPEGWVKAASQFQADVLEWWRTAVDETRELLSLAQRGIESGVLGNDVDVLSGLGCFDKRVNGAGTRSCVGAVYLASRTAPPTDKRPRGCRVPSERRLRHTGIHDGGTFRSLARPKMVGEHGNCGPRSALHRGNGRQVRGFGAGGVNTMRQCPPATS